jgi:hypothetical protein
MSLWFFRRAKKGERLVWLIDVPLLPTLALVGATVGVLLSMVCQYPMATAIGSVGMMLIGYACLVSAKISLFRRGIWISWGPRLMSVGCARLYRAGYGLIGFGGALLLLTWKLTA